MEASLDLKCQDNKFYSLSVQSTKKFHGDLQWQYEYDGVTVDLQLDHRSTFTCLQLQVDDFETHRSENSRASDNKSAVDLASQYGALTGDEPSEEEWWLPAASYQQNDD